MDLKYEFDHLVHDYGLEAEYISYTEEYAADSITRLATAFSSETGGNGMNSYNLENHFWTGFDERYLRHNLGWTVTLVIAYTAVFIVGIIGNLMVILVVIKCPQMRKVTNFFILNLAVADLFLIELSAPATLVYNIFKPWILGLITCKGVAYVQGVSVCASAYSLVPISLDRCKAICRPLQKPKGFSRRQAILTICLIWIIAMTLILPWAVILNVVVNKTDGISHCIELWENELNGKIYFLIANLFFCYCFPLILISISNILIWCNHSKGKVPADSVSAIIVKKMHRKTRHGVFRMLTIVTLSFLLSWLPLYIIVTRVKFTKHMNDRESHMHVTLLPLAQWLGNWNSSINPVLYAFLNSKFRETFKSLFPKWMPFIHKREN